MKRTKFEVVAEQRRNDWVAEYFLDLVQRCLHSSTFQKIGKQQAHDIVERIAEYAEAQGWSVAWRKNPENHWDELVLNNGGVVVRICEWTNPEERENRNKSRLQNLELMGGSALTL